MEKPPSSSGSAALEQFILLSKTAKGAAAAELIRQALATPGIYVFGELLEMPNIKEVRYCFRSFAHNVGLKCACFFTWLVIRE